jgi:hypothetical protein
MRRKLIGLLVAGCLPGVAVADTMADRIRVLQAQLDVLKKEMAGLQARPSDRPAIAAPAPVDPSSPDYGRAPATLTNDDVTAVKQQLAAQQLKVNSLEDAANTGPIAGLSVTGYIDPTYVYNRAQGGSSFLFANHESTGGYFNSTFGDLYLDIKKTFGVGPMAP